MGHWASWCWEAYFLGRLSISSASSYLRTPGGIRSTVRQRTVLLVIHEVHNLRCRYSAVHLIFLGILSSASVHSLGLRQCDWNTLLEDTKVQQVTSVVDTVVNRNNQPYKLSGNIESFLILGRST